MIQRVKLRLMLEWVEKACPSESMISVWKMGFPYVLMNAVVIVRELSPPAIRLVSVCANVPISAELMDEGYLSAPTCETI